MIPPRFRIQAEARRDLNRYTDHLLAVAGSEVALRFVAGAKETFAALGNAPELGPSVPSRNQRLAALRKWRVAGFPKLLIFYQPESDGVRILRILHAAQDWWSLLDAD